MKGFITMLKINIKLLIRNKGYLCFLILLPLFSILLLNIQTSDSYNLDNNNNYIIHEMEPGERTPLDMTNTRLNVMVMDSSRSYLSDFILQQLTDTGSYQFYRYQTGISSWEEAESQAVAFANKNTITAVLYISPDFVPGIMAEEKDPLLFLFATSEDGRIPLLQENIKSILNSLCTYRELSGEDPAVFKDLVDTVSKDQLHKNTVSVIPDDEIHLSVKQQNQRSNIGYSLAIVSIAFLFSGIFIGSIVIDERQNLVFTRILLTNTTIYSYGIVKLILTIITTIIQTLVMGTGILLFVKADFGLSLSDYLFFIFGIGIIFNFLSVVTAVVTDNLLSSSCVAYFIWVISAMLSGLYFPLDTATSWWRRISLLMPPRWVVKCSEMVMVGQSGAYFTFLLIVFAFIAIILSVGLIGIKTKK